MAQADFPFRILIAEDNTVNQKVLRIILEKGGYSFDLVTDGAQAVHKFESGSYELILMDCQMPEKDGLQATREIREIENRHHRNRCSIIAMTANAMAGDRERCLQAGMDDFLAKPFKSQELVKLLSSWVNK